ncbi:unnamed protein product [Knipowitschia caucasica]
MAGFIPGLLPTNHNQEKEFAQAYEDVLERYKDERDRVQKKTFTKWVNKHLIKVRKHITDLYEDLRDGHNLISLLEVLSGVTLPREKGRMRFHRLQNVQIALDFLKQRQVKLVNIRNDDITDGNPKLTLGLIWTIILHFQISEIYVSGESGDLTAKEKLLLWSQKATEGYPGLRCSNFSSSWSDGRMFNALLHRYRPDLIDMKLLERQSNRENLEQAFEIAESLGVTRLLDAEDVDVPSPDEKSVITYVSSIYDAFPKIPEGGEGVAAHEVDQRWSEYQARFSSLLQWSRQHTALMANKNFPQNPVELKALYNEYVHFKETEIPSKEKEKGHIEHLYKLLEVWIEFGRIKLPQGLHPNDLEEEWGKLILEMLEREKALRPAVDRLELLLQRANKIQNMALDCEEKLTLAKNTLQADMSRVESGQTVQCEREMACYLQDCESLIRNLNQELKVLRDERYYQVEQLAFRVSCLQEELVSLRLQCSSLYRKGHFGQTVGTELTQRPQDRGLSLGQTLLGAVGAVGMMGAALLRRPMDRSQLVAMSSSEDEGSLRFIYELLGWVEETQDVLEQAEWGADLPSVEKHLTEHNAVHTAVEELMSGLQEARSYESKVSPNFKSSYSETLAKLEHQYCKLLEQSSWRLRSLESLHGFVSRCTEELIWLNEREEEELPFDWSHHNHNMSGKRQIHTETRLELEDKQEVMRSLQETAGRLCQENHPAKQTVEAYSAALQTQWQWVKQLCVCVEQHLKDNTAYFQFMSDARDSESYLRQLQDTIKRQYTCDKSSRLSKLEDLLQDSMEEKEQLIEYRRAVAGLVGRAKSVVQLKPRSADTPLASTTPIKAICDYKQIEITINSGEECVLEDNSHRTKWKVISPTGNEAMVPSVCFTIPPPNQDAIDTAARAEQLYQKVMSLWHQLHVNMKSVVSWNYLLKDIRTISAWSLDTVRCQSPSERQQTLEHLESHWSDFVSDSKESALFSVEDRQALERDVLQAQQHCQDLLLNMETEEKDESVSRSYLSELQNITLRLNEAEQRLTRSIQTPLPILLTSEPRDLSQHGLHITEQETLLLELDGLRSGLGDVSRRCVRFFEEKPSSSSIPALRSELNYAVEKTDKLHNLSSVFLQKLKTVDVLIQSLDEAEGQVRKYESRLSEEDIVPPDTAAIRTLRDQLQRWQTEVSDQEGVFQSLQSEVVQAKEAGSQLSRIHPDRSPELDRYQEKANQMIDRWSSVKRQIDSRQTELEALCSSLQLYRDGHSALIKWIEETTDRQENTHPSQSDSKALSEQLAQQTALVAEIERNQTKLDECQTHSKQYCTAVKDYELQLMTYRAFVESTHKSNVTRRRLHSSSDAVTQEFMDLRTRYTALVTLTTQHVKYISDALRRLEEEEKEVEEEKQARVGQVSDLLGWVKGLQGRTGGPNAESSLAAQQAITEQLASKKDEVAEAIRSTEVFLKSKQASKLSPEERRQVEAQLDDLKATYNQLCTSSNQQLQQLEQQLAKEEERKTHPVIAGVIDLATVETFPVFQAAQRGLIDQDTCLALLEAQLVWGGLLQPQSGATASLELGENEGLVNHHMQQCLSELNSALCVVGKGLQTNARSIVDAIGNALIREELGLRLLAFQLNSGGLVGPDKTLISIEQAENKKILTPNLARKLHSLLNTKELIDPNTAEKLNISELQQRCIGDEGSQFLLLPVKQQAGGTVSVRTGKKVGIFRAVQEGIIDRKVTIRLLEAQLFAGGIADPRSGHRLTIEEAVSHGLMDQDLACAMLARQLQNGGIIDPFCDGERLCLEESIRRNLLSRHLALLVLESRCSFMGMLWTKSGEVLPIAEALQQGVISAELAKNMLRQRHAIGALYNPETLQVLPFNDTAKETLGINTVRILQETHIPDLISPSSLTSSSPTPPSSPLATSFPTPPVWNVQSINNQDPEEEAKQKLLFHIMTHSYMDAHTGRRFVLLDTELLELVATSDHLAGEENQLEGTEIAAVPGLKHLEKDGAEIMRIHEVIRKEAKLEVDKIIKQSSEIVKLLDIQNYKQTKVTMEKVDGKQKNISTMANVEASNDVINAKPLSIDATISPSESEKNVLLRDPQMDKLEPPLCAFQVMDAGVDLKQINNDQEIMSQLVAELKQGGLRTPEGDRLLPDEAVAQDILPGHTAVKLMSQAGLFGGFLDARSGEVLAMDNLMNEGMEDEDLMWSILKSDKTLSGIVDAKNGNILGVTEAAKEGLIDTNTCTRLLEAQVVSGGIVDLQQDKKISVTLASNMGLIEKEQREQLIALEKAYKGKKTDPANALIKATLQLQIEGIVDPKSKSALPLGMALEIGLIKPEDAYNVLAKQVAEGGIIHHESGLRLSVSDAVNRGLVDRSLAPGLEELEWVYHGKISQSSNHEAMVLQASTGAIMDPSSGQKLTLTEAVSKGLLDEEIANNAMASSVVTHSVIDPQTACIVPYSELANQGKIDIETGKRFLEVKPFRGVQDEKTGEIMTLSQAVAAKIVDPIPAIRILQSQADSGGIVDINTGDRVGLVEAMDKGLVNEDIVKAIAIYQVNKGGLVDPTSGQKVAEMGDAIAKGLVPKELAQDIYGKTPSMEKESLSDSSTPIYPLSSGSEHSPAISLSICCADSNETWSDSNIDSKLIECYEGGFVAQEKLSPESEQSTEEILKVVPDKSLDVLSTFAANVEKKIQKAIEEISPQKDGNVEVNATKMPTFKTENKDINMSDKVLTTEDISHIELAQSSRGVTLPFVGSSPENNTQNIPENKGHKSYDSIKPVCESQVVAKPEKDTAMLKEVDSLHFEGQIIPMVSRLASSDSVNQTFTDILKPIQDNAGEMAQVKNDSEDFSQTKLRKSSQDVKLLSVESPLQCHTEFISENKQRASDDTIKAVCESKVVAKPEKNIAKSNKHTIKDILKPNQERAGGLAQVNISNKPLAVPSSASENGNTKDKTLKRKEVSKDGKERTDNVEKDDVVEYKEESKVIKPGVKKDGVTVVDKTPTSVGINLKTLEKKSKLKKEVSEKTKKGIGAKLPGMILAQQCPENMDISSKAVENNVIEEERRPSKSKGTKIEIENEDGITSKPVENLEKVCPVIETSDPLDKIGNLGTKAMIIERSIPIMGKETKDINPAESEAKSSTYVVKDARLDTVTGPMVAEIKSSDPKMTVTTSCESESDAGQCTSKEPKSTAETTKKNGRAKGGKKIKKPEMVKPIFSQDIKATQPHGSSPEIKPDAKLQNDSVQEDKSFEIASVPKDKDVHVAIQPLQTPVKTYSDVNISNEVLAPPPPTDVDGKSKKKRRNTKAKGNGADALEEQPIVPSEADRKTETCPEVVNDFERTKTKDEPSSVEDVQVKMLANTATKMKEAPVLQKVIESEAKEVMGRKKMKKVEKTDGNDETKDVFEVLEEKVKEEECVSLQKSPLPENEKAALVMKAKESILKKVFEKGVSERQAAEELQALRKEVVKKDDVVKSKVESKVPGKMQIDLNGQKEGQSTTNKQRVKESDDKMDQVAKLKEVESSKVVPLTDVTKVQQDTVKETHSKRHKKHKKAKTEMNSSSDINEEKPLSKDSVVSGDTKNMDNQKPTVSGSSIDQQKVSNSTQSEKCKIGLTTPPPGQTPDLLNTGDFGQSNQAGNASEIQPRFASGKMEMANKGIKMEDKLETKPPIEIEVQEVDRPEVLEMITTPKNVKSTKAANNLTEEQAKGAEGPIMKNQPASLKTGKASLKKQECLELDQQMVALVSMVRHIEVQLKQQQQQSVGRSLIALNDIIQQSEALDLELQDLEPQIHNQLQASQQLLKPTPEDVPPQLLLALEKDQRSLSRGYEAAKALSEGILKSLKEQRDTHKEAVAVELSSLSDRAKVLLLWLKQTEAKVSENMTGTEEPAGGSPLTQQLQLCKELQNALKPRSNDVQDLAFDIQVFISERAQDLSPEQSRGVLGQLQQLQRELQQTTDHIQAWSTALTTQRDTEEEQRRRERAREREVVQQQKAECSQKMENLAMYLAGAASLLASHVTGGQTGDVNVLQEKQRKLQEVQKDLQSKSEGIADAIRSVEELLAEKGDSLSPEEKAKLQVALEKMKEQYSALNDTANTSLSEVTSAISTTVHQNTQRAKAEEELQETQGQIDSLLKELSSLDQLGAKGTGGNGTQVDSKLLPPEGAVKSHTDMLQSELQQLQAQQAQLLQVSQSVRSLLEQPDSAVPPEEKRRLRAELDQLQAQHQDRLHNCQERLRKSEALKDELTKFLQEHGGLVLWLDQSEQELRSLGEGETDAPGLKGRMEEHRKLSEDVICHKADLRFVSISGQKVLDSVQGALEQVGGSDPSLDSTKQLVTDKLQDANHRYTALHTKSTELSGRLSGLLERYQQYQDEMVSLHSWLSAQEQNQSINKSTVDTDPQNLQNTLRQVQTLQDEMAERSVQLEKVKRAGRDLVSTEESPCLKAVDILCAADGLEKRFGSLSSSVSERAEQLQTAVAQSVSVQEGLKTLLSWFDQLPLQPGPVLPTAQAVQEALTQNQKLRQELLSRQGSVDATREAVSRLLQSSDASMASGLKRSLDQLTQRFSAAQASQAEREAELKALLPRLENHERLGADLQLFTQSRQKALSPVGQPDRSVEDYRQTIEEVKSELEQESGQLKSFCSLGSELSQSRTFSNTQSLLDNVKEVSDEFHQLETSVNKRFDAIHACEEQLHQFRGLSGSLHRWLQSAQDQLPAKETGLNTDGLQRRVQQLTDLLNDWESQGSRVQELNKKGSELETLIIDITAPQTKTGAPHINGSSGPGSLNGIHTCKDLTELQVAVSDVNSRFEGLGLDLKERLSKQRSSLELRQKATEGTDELKGWLTQKESSFTQTQVASPSKSEAVRAQAQENKELLSELAERTVKVEELKSTLRKLIAENPDSPEAETWRQQLQDIDSRWQATNQTAAQRQQELETCADRLGTFSSAANQLAPWLREKELMMSVLGPLSIDPNMLSTQKQQVQFMLREFETRRPQFDQLTQSAEGILSQADGAQEASDLGEVRAELGSIRQQWDGLTDRLSQRSSHIDQAQGTSERFQALLRELSSSVSALGEQLDAQASLSAQPEALKQRLQETGQIRSELERRREELGEAEQLCQELSAIVVEPYLKEELKKRLDSVSGPLRNLEERAADGLSQLQAALSSTQQFQQMFEELRSWLDNQADLKEASSVAMPCQPEAIRSLLSHTDDLQRGIASQRGSYELLQAEGASLLASLPSGGDERTALQCQLSGLKRDWEGLNEKISERESKLKNTLTKAEAYQRHKSDLVPWLSDCEERDRAIQPSLESSALDECLQKAKALGMEMEKRQPHLEAFNTAADQLLEQCCIGDEEVRDEKAQLNRRVDRLGESVHSRTSHLEELSGRLREFEEGRAAVERRLEAAKHQIEVQEALGPQACSAKSLERLRSQQDNLRSLQPQVVYLKDLAQGLVQDAPQALGGSTEGADRLQTHAKETEKEYEQVTEKIESCCSSLESRLQGVGQVQSHVRDVFSRLADLDDELDSLSPVGRDADSLSSQADALRGLLSRLGGLRSELEEHATQCSDMLHREGSSPDLLALRRETEALSRQAGKLSERGQARLDQIEDASERVRDFYRLVSELQSMLGGAEQGLEAQAVVGPEVDTIKQQLHEFKAVEREQVDCIQPKLQHVNAVGQGLIQSAAKHTDTQALEHDLETTNLRWNSLNKRVAERIAQLQEALLHCGKFQDALEPLLSWLSDTEELVANQKPPSAEYRVVKAQIQEQKLLQRLLDDRRPTVEMIRAEGERIAATADATDRDKIQTQLQSLAQRWSSLLDKASGRQRQLEELQVLALEFHESLEPLGEWLSATERRLSSAEPMGTQTAKITQQITKHKTHQDKVSSRGADVDHLESLRLSLTPLSCTADRHWLDERVGAVRSGHSELSDWCARRAAMLEQALANAQLFGEDEVEVMNWLAEVSQRLGQVSVQSYHPQELNQQHKHTLALNEEIVSRKKTVDQAIKNGQALLKQTTGEEVLLIQEKLDGIKSRYAEMTAGSSKALRTLEQALQLATRFSSANEDLNQWLDSVETELNNSEPDATPAYQKRQKELKKVSAEKRLVLDTVNEVGSALLDLVPWRAREGLDRLVSDANQRYRTADDTITQRVQLVQAAIQRSQRYEEAVDAELAWVGDTERKLSSLGPLSLEPDVTVAQLQVQRAFNIDIIRHKDTVDQLLATRDEILETCNDSQKDALLVKTDSLNLRYEAVNQTHSERFSALEQAQVLVARFWETYEELEPWLGETEALIAQLPPPAIDTDALRLQQDHMRLLRESIAEHKPHIDKLLKIGPQMAELSLHEGETVTRRYDDAERRYIAIKEEVKRRAGTLDEAVSQSAQFHDKMDPLLETLEAAVQRLRQPPPVAAEVDKIREQLSDHRALGLELDKLLPSFSALCSRGEELIGRAAHDDPAAQAVRSRLLRLRSLWDEIRQRAEEREGKLNDVLDLAGKFWSDVAALLSTLRDSQDIVKELEDPGVDPSLIKQQIEAAEAIKAETDGLREELEFVRTLGADLIFACGETEKPEVKKTIDEMNAAWEGLDRTWRERMERLEEAMTASVQYQDALQSMFDYLDNAVIKLCDMSIVGTDLGTVKQQIEELKQYKVEVYQQQIDMEKLCHQGELLLKKVSDQTDRDMIQEPLIELRHLWENLGDKITQRQHKLEAALLALGQFQHALSEIQAWLSHTHATLDTQRPVSSDPKAIEIELAKHHVLRNDVLSHHATVDTVNNAAAELLESSPGDEASHLREQLEQLNQSWEGLLLKTQDRQKLLEAALQQAEGFHGELEEFLQWLRRTDSHLSAAKPTGGLPETAREQLQQHLELQAQLMHRAEQYHRLLDQGESMLLARGEDAGPGATQTQQNLAMLQNKWTSLNAKMDDRKAKLEEAVTLATGFQTSLQDTINWLTQAEQTLNMAQPPSLMLDTVLFQIDEHKVFVNEVNTHREQVLALEKAGSQLRFASLKQDVVLIKNLLLSVQARWDKLVQRSLDRGRHLDEARKRAKQFHEAWRKLTDWLEEAEKRLDSELEISNEPDKIKVQLTKHKEFQKAMGSKQPVYDTTVRSGRAMRDKAQLPDDKQKLDHLVGEVRDKWDTVCGKSVERQHKLEEALLFSGQFAEALQALVDWLYRVEPQLAEDQPVHGDLDLVSNLMDAHKAFQKELGKRTTNIQALKRSARDLMDTGRDDTAWVKVQLQELSNRWDTVCALSVTKQTRLQQALKQAEEFRSSVQVLLEWLSEAEQSLRFRGVLPEEAETLQGLLHAHRDFLGSVEDKRGDVNKAAGMGEAILTLCHPDSITTIKHWITIIRARFEEVLTWAKQHEQRLETALTEVLNNANLLEELLSWLQFAESTLIQRDTDALPQDIPQLKTLISEHQTFMEEMTRKQPDVDKVTKSYKRKPSETLAERRGARKHQQQQQGAVQVTSANPRLNQLCARWQQVWLLALDWQRKLNDALDRLEELKEFANFDFDVWRKKYMRWMNHKKSRVMDFFRRIDKDQDGKITRQEFIDGILASKFPTSKLEMTAVADIFDRDGDGYIDYYEFVAALHPNKDAYRPTTDADKIEDEVTRQVAQCKCAKRFQVEQIGENKYRFFLGNQFGDSQQLRLVRILRSTVMVRVGGGWMALDEFLVKNDPCRVQHPGLKILRSDSSSSISSRIARGRTNLELREKFILPEGTGMAAFRSRGRRSKPGSRNASPTRSSSSASHSGASGPSAPSAPATPTTSASSRGAPSGSKLKRPTFHSSRGSLTGENGGTTHSGKTTRSDPKRGGCTSTSRAGSRAGSRASSRRGSDASDASELQDSRSVCSDTSDTPRRPGGGAKPSKIPTISKKTPSPKTTSAAKK